MYTHRRSIQGRWTENMWSNYPVHEIEKRDPLPQYIYDLGPFMETRKEKRTPKVNEVSEMLEVEKQKVNLDNLLKSKPEYLDPNYVEKYKKEK